MDKSRERVLVVPTEIFHELGVFQGFTTDVRRYLPALLKREHLSYRAREDVETDPTFKQLIPYVVLRHADTLFHYTRGKKGSESRLQALRSIGVGGHINEGDATLFESPYREALDREVAEEVEIASEYAEQCLGLINDDSNAVGAVHLGIVHVFELREPAVRRREAVLTRSGFAPTRELHTAREQFETWSQLVLDHLVESA